MTTAAKTAAAAPPLPLNVTREAMTHLYASCALPQRMVVLGRAP